MTTSKVPLKNITRIEGMSLSVFHGYSLLKLILTLLNPLVDIYFVDSHTPLKASEVSSRVPSVKLPTLV